MMKTYTLALSLVMLVALQFSANAQCKMFNQKKCFSTLQTYTNNGSYNGAVMFEGEEATLTQTFYEGQDYRLVLCSQEVIASVAYFEIRDYANNVIYTSKDANSNVFDFSVESTQSLKMRIAVPNIGTDPNLKQNGCVSVIVGFKSSETSDALNNPYQNFK
jgi:hypothetical protein